MDRSRNDSCFPCCANVVEATIGAERMAASIHDLGRV
jgi:hypothetical protein